MAGGGQAIDTLETGPVGPDRFGGQKGCVPMKLNVFKRQTPPPAPPERKASVTGAILAMSGQGPVAWSPRDTA